MQSVIKGPIVPEHSAQLAAQFIKMLQSSPQETASSTSIIVTTSSETNAETQSINSTSTISSPKIILSSGIESSKNEKVNKSPEKRREITEKKTQETKASNSTVIKPKPQECKKETIPKEKQSSLKKQGDKLKK